MGCSCIPRAGREGPETPLPKFRVFVLLCITVSEGFSLNMLFPFVSYMVRSFGYTSAADVGRHAAVCVCVCVCVCALACMAGIHAACVADKLLRGVRRKRVWLRPVPWVLLLGCFV